MESIAAWEADHGPLIGPGFLSGHHCPVYLPGNLQSTFHSMTWDSAAEKTNTKLLLMDPL